MVDYSTVGDIAFLRLDNPPLNVITPVLLDELVRAVDRVNEDSSITGAVITGNSDHFTAGADIKLFTEITDNKSAMSLSAHFQKAFSDIERSEKPLITAKSFIE